jgi:hypothetical protein
MTLFSKIVQKFVDIGEKTSGDVAKVQTILQAHTPAFALVVAPWIALFQSVAAQSIGTAIDTAAEFGIPLLPGDTPWPPPASGSLPLTPTTAVSSAAGPVKAQVSGLQLFTTFVAGVPPGQLANVDLPGAFKACTTIAGGMYDLAKSVNAPEEPVAVVAAKPVPIAPAKA